MAISKQTNVFWGGQNYYNIHEFRETDNIRTSKAYDYNISF